MLSIQSVRDQCIVRVKIVEDDICIGSTAGSEYDYLGYLGKLL